jgi:uncharacterized membrane protein
MIGSEHIQPMPVGASERNGKGTSVMAKNLKVVAAIYPDQEHANTILETLQKMHRASNITLTDAALVTKDEQGKIHIDETKEVTTGKGAKRGAIIAGIFGVIYPPSLIASVAAGGGIGALWGKLRDTGIKTGDMKEITENLKPGQVALITLATPESVPPIERAMDGWEGYIVRHGFTEEESARLEQAAAEAAEAAPPVEIPTPAEAAATAAAPATNAGDPPSQSP